MRRYQPKGEFGKTRIPIYDDVKYGSGGIAGGKFTSQSYDVADLAAENYVASDYISGQGGYILGDM